MSNLLPATAAPEGLVARSVEAMLGSQDESGAFVASPDFSQYHFCWLRDASFVAYALDRSYEHEASARYHRWVARAITGITDKIEAAIDARSAGAVSEPVDMPPARFALDGSVVTDDWPNFQTDGYGTWIWSLAEHLRRAPNRAIFSELAPVVRLVARYLAAEAFRPCFDVWEEGPDLVHTSTLACVYAGLSAAGALLGDEAASRQSLAIRQQLLELAAGGFFPKDAWPGDAGPEDSGPEEPGAAVDASCIWVATPFRAVTPGDERMSATIAAIEARLGLDGGLRRYTADTYYGGGAWPVLSASLGWYQAETGDFDGARRCLEWVESCFDTEGRLPEQVGGEHLAPAQHAEWVERWGPPARQLIWSHAMHVVLASELKEKGEIEPGTGSSR